MCAAELDTNEHAVDVDQDQKARNAEVDVKAAQREQIQQSAAEESSSELAREVGASSQAVIHTGGGGGDGRPRRLLLIALQGASPDLVLNAWRKELRTFDLLLDRGAWSRLLAPPATVGLPNWLSVFSGLDAGQLGVYGQHRRVNHSYTQPVVVDNRMVRDPRIWDLLGVNNKLIGVIGAPATTPAPTVHGYLIGDTPLSDGAPSTFPGKLAQQVHTWLGDTSLSPGVPAQFLPSDTQELDRAIQQVYTRAEQQFMLARRLLARDSYDCFVVAIDGIATIQRLLWDSFDSSHPRYTEEHPFAGTIGSFYRFVDDQLFELLELVDDDTIVAVVSPGGVRSLLGEFALNEWLIEQGDLVLHTPPQQPGELALASVDWARTRAWADDNGAIYLNVAGREPQGTIAQEQVEQVRRELIERLQGLTDPTGERVLQVQRPELLFPSLQGVAPDLLVAYNRPGWRVTAQVGRGDVWCDARSVQMDAAVETPYGFMVLYDPHNLGGGRQLDDAMLADVVPTLLTLLGHNIPARLRGRVMVGV